MIQAPSLMGPKVNPAQQYTVNPVQPVTIKIDIQPQQQQEPQKQAVTAPIYNYPTASVYDMPKQSVLEPKQEQPKVVEAPKQEAVIAPKSEVKAEIKAEDKKPEAKVEDKKVEHKKPEIVAPETIKPGIDLDGLVSILSSSDYDEQADAMEAISEVAMLAPDKASEIIDVKVIDILLNLMNKDTSNLQGVEKQKAEKNKEYAMFTTSTLQKLYADEIQKKANTTVPIDELVGMAGIVKELKTNSNPNVREAAVASLGYVTRPEYKNVLAHLFSEAASDKDSKVKMQAEKQLGKVLNASA